MNQEEKEKLKCDLCGKDLEVKEDELVNGLVLVFDDGKNKYKTLRCKDCYEKDQSLKNYQECEVYSRVVGYLRPINQWNEGKKKEFNERQNYSNNI